MEEIEKQSTSTYVSYLLESEEQFYFPGFKVINAQTQNWIPCNKSVYNGKIKLTYITKDFTALSSEMETISFDKITWLIAEIVHFSLKILENGFIRCDCVELSLDNIYMDAVNQTVYFLCVPLVSENREAEQEKFISDVKALCIFLLERFPKKEVLRVCTMLKNPKVTLVELEREISIWSRSFPKHDLDEKDNRITVLQEKQEGMKLHRDIATEGESIEKKVEFLVTESEEKPFKEKKLKKRKNGLKSYVCIGIVACLGIGVLVLGSSKISNNFFNRPNVRKINTTEKPTVSMKVTIKPENTIEPIKKIETCIVIDVKNMKQKKATQDLKQLGLTIKIKKNYSDTVQKGKVIRQSIAAGEKVNLKTEIVLWISKGKKKAVHTEKPKNEEKEKTPSVEISKTKSPKVTKSPKKDKKAKKEEWDIIEE